VTDDELVAAFEGGRIRGDDFRHVDHVHVGFLFIGRSYCAHRASAVLGV
jgi:hypothetical protein